MKTASCLAVLLLLAGPEARAQVRRVGPGSTVQGDVLRGEGVYLQGAGWYELNDARAAAINTRTAMAIADWNDQVYKAYRREWDQQITRHKYATTKLQEEAQRKQAEKEARLRTNPTIEDMQSGDALNALLIELSDPSIDYAAWRLAQVPLPPELKLKKLIFRFAPKPGAKGSTELGQGVIALARLDQHESWPNLLRMPELAKEREAYEGAYRKLRDECVGDRLDLATITGVDAAIQALKDKAAATIPTTRNFRSSAVAYVRDLGDATKMFSADTLDFAGEIIRDTEGHEAATVGELLAFMRKYRLMFASAEKVPGGADLYARLYGLMREQRAKLKPRRDDPAGPVAKAAEAPRPAEPPRSAKEQLEDARTELMKVNFGKNAERGPKKRHAIQSVVAAIKASGQKRPTIEPIEEALKEIESLLGDGKRMDPNNAAYLKRAAEKLAAVKDGLK